MSRAPSPKSELSPIEMGDEGDQQTAGGGETSGGGNVDNIPPPPPSIGFTESRANHFGNFKDCQGRIPSLWR